MFTLGSERFGLLAARVREVVRAVAIAGLPHAPPIVEGVVNVRGTVVPVLDIRRRFGLPAVPLSPEQHFVIADAAQRVVALRVDRATELLTVEAGASEASGELPPGVEYVAGVVKLPDGLLVIHDLDAFLALDEAAQLDAAVAGSPEPEPIVSRKRSR